MDTYIYILVLIFFAGLVMLGSKEPLSLTQFPVPTCSTCKSCKFYTCGKCGDIYQEQNKIGQPCDCGGFTVYRTRSNPSCYKQTLKGRPGEAFEAPFCKGCKKSGCKGCICKYCHKCNCKKCTCKQCHKCNCNLNFYKGSCKSCKKDEYTCLQAAGTFDSGTTFLRNLPCPVPFPPVLPGMELTAHKQSRHVSELDIYKHLEEGGLVISANTGKIAEYALQKLVQNTLARGNQGYPNFYYIQGPILVLSKVGDDYFWMIDYPIKYNPENFSKYVNTSKSWNITKTAYKAGRRLLNDDAPFFFFDADSKVRVELEKYACIPKGEPQSSTDYYYPGCTSKSCLWGPDYGSGNWLNRV